MGAKDPKYKKHVDVMLLKNWGLFNDKDILFTYFGKWSLQSLVDSGEFALLIPYESTIAFGYDGCDEDTKSLNRVSAYTGHLYLLDVEINGKPSPSVYVLFGCEKNQIKTSMLWGTYDIFKLSLMLIDAQTNPIQFNRIETKEKTLSRYAKTRKALVKRYGKKGSGFWEWGAKNHLFGKRKIESPQIVKFD
eukprot:UN04913